MSSQGPSQSQQYNWLDKSWGGAVRYKEGVLEEVLLW